MHRPPTASARPSCQTGSYHASKQQSVDALSARRPKWVLIRGAFNSGTHAAQTMLQLNRFRVWANDRGFVVPPPREDADIIQRGPATYSALAPATAAEPPTPAPFGCWKHTPPALLNAANVTDTDVVRASFLTLVLARHPLEWMASVAKAAYTITCADPTLGLACTIASDWDSYRACAGPSMDPGRLTFPTLEAMWLSYYREFFRLRAPHYILRYEDMLLHSDGVLSSLCGPAGADCRLNVSLRDRWKNDIAQAKVHGAPRTRSQSMQMLASPVTCTAGKPFVGNFSTHLRHKCEKTRIGCEPIKLSWEAIQRARRNAEVRRVAARYGYTLDC